MEGSFLLHAKSYYSLNVSVRARSSIYLMYFLYFGLCREMETCLEMNTCTCISSRIYLVVPLLKYQWDMVVRTKKEESTSILYTSSNQPKILQVLEILLLSKENSLILIRINTSLFLENLEISCAILMHFRINHFFTSYSIK